MCRKGFGMCLPDSNCTFGDYGHQTFGHEEGAFYPTDTLTSRLSATLVVIFVLACISYGYMTLTTLARLTNKFPGSRILPFIGTLSDFFVPSVAVATTKIFHKVTKMYGRNFRFWTLHIPYVGIAEANAAEKVLSNSQHLDKGKDYKRLRWMLGNGLVTSEVHIWKEDRKLLNPLFKYQNFDAFLTSFNKQSKILVSILKKEFQTCLNPKEVHGLLCSCTMDSISEGVLDFDLGCQINPNDDFLKAAKIGIASIQTRLLRPWLIVPILWDVFGMGRQERWWLGVGKALLAKGTAERREKLKNMKVVAGEDVTKPVIDILMERKSPEDVFHHIMTIFGAGFETTATGINFTLFLLALNRDCQAVAQQEIDRIYENSDSICNKDITFAELAELKYLELCIKEALRIFPPVPFLARNIHSDIKLDNGLVIPAGVDAVIFINELHRDPAVFPDPERFDPMRFLPELCAVRHRYAYAPFSLGPRSCIGQKYAMMQMKVILVNLLRNFSIRTELKREDIDIIYGIVSHTTQPITLTLTHRNK